MKRTALLGGACAVAGLALTASPALAAGRNPGGVIIPAKSGEVLPQHGGSATSLNWSGYAVTPAKGGITAVNSSFVVPAASLFPDPVGFAATWAGIGGYSSSDLIQAGVSENTTLTASISGGQYYAWYEILPASETEITSGCSGNTSCAVTPGDKVTVNIVNAGTNQWTVKLSDAGKWTWSKTLSYTSTESSAEWILEAPTVGAQSSLANVGTAKFGPTSTYVTGGQTHAIAAGDPTQIDLSPSPVALPDGVGDEATPSGLASDGQSFNDCAYAVSCPAP